MDEKITGYLAGEMTDEEKSRLFREMENDPELKEKFIEAQHNYSLSQMMSRPDDEQYAERKLQELNRQVRKTKIRHLIRQTSKYAALLLLAIGLWWVFQLYTSDKSEDVQYREYVSEPGRRKEIRLPDGTKVHLGPASKIKVPVEFTADVRQVELDGEALFDVNANPDRPFIVKTELYDIKVSGTVFNTIAYSQHSVFETSLLEGAVTVYNRHEKVELKPHEGVSRVNDKLVKSEADLNDIYYLQSGLYRFEEASLKKLFNKLSMWYNVEFEITNRRMLENTLSGKFRENDNIEHILTAIQLLYPFRYKKSENATYIIY